MYKLRFCPNVVATFMLYNMHVNLSMPGSQLYVWLSMPTQL